MCGFVGAISKRGKPFPQETLEAMTSMIWRRGPDDEGFFSAPDGWLSMGFRRLSILDLSAKGHQPMLSHDGRHAIVFNGEVYNFRELRRELESSYPFVSNSDTEVVLAAFRAWGPGCVKRFSGMFAFMLADLQERRVLLCRDQLGVKPLLHYEDDDFHIFCSEAKALLPYTELRPDPASFQEYLVFRSVLGRRTMFQGVKNLLPGHTLQVAGGKLSEYCYFNLADTLRPDPKMGFAEACERTEAAFTDSVKLHLRSDVPLGVQLSGGVDSSLITAFASRETGRRLHSFSVSFGEEEYDESKYQKWVSERYNTEHHDFPVGSDAFTQLLPETLWHYEHPLNDPNAVCSHYLMSRVKEHVTVLLAGEGADEAFLGYMRFLPGPQRTLRRRTWLYRHKALRETLRRLWPLERGAALLRVTRYNPAMYGLNYNDLNSVDLLLDGDESSMGFRRSMVEAAKGDVLNEAILQDQACDLPQWFRRADGIGMASSLELRVPFCTADMFTLANSIPYAARVQGGERKAVLKKISEKHLDHELIYRKKIGFSTPLAHWSGEGQTWGRLLRDTLGSESFRSRPWLNKRHFDSFYQPFLAGRYNETRCGWLWTYSNLELWHRLFFEGGWRAFAKK